MFKDQPLLKLVNSYLIASCSSLLSVMIHSRYAFAKVILYINKFINTTPRPCNHISCEVSESNLIYIAALIYEFIVIVFNYIKKEWWIIAYLFMIGLLFSWFSSRKTAKVLILNLDFMPLFYIFSGTYACMIHLICRHLRQKDAYVTWILLYVFTIGALISYITFNYLYSNFNLNISWLHWVMDILVLVGVGVTVPDVFYMEDRGIGASGSGGGGGPAPAPAPDPAPALINAHTGVGGDLKVSKVNGPIAFPGSNTFVFNPSGGNQPYLRCLAEALEHQKKNLGHRSLSRFTFGPRLEAQVLACIQVNNQHLHAKITNNIATGDQVWYGIANSTDFQYMFRFCA